MEYLIAPLLTAVALGALIYGAVLLFVGRG